MKLTILKYPDHKLRRKAQDVKEINKDLKQLARKMLDLMYKENGIGLAATQVGRPLRMVVINLSKKPEGELVLVNPKITKKSGKLCEEEGCLSVPGFSAKVPRHKRILCEALNLDGQKIEIDTGLVPVSEDKNIQENLSRVIQHETDHLNGVLFVDYLTGEEKKIFDGKAKS
ncbi:MAG: peptide deformylase [Planctomycetes bacterium]|nr:peptide deformylase [Planctomycetota bacterium]